MPRYEYKEGTSNKFWEIERDGTTLTVRWGRIGAAGRNEKVYEHATDEEATKKYDKLVAEKTGKGYARVGGKAPTSAKPTKEAKNATSAKATKPTTATKATKATRTAAPAWLAAVRPTEKVKGKAGRIFDVEGESDSDGGPIELAKVEKNLKLPLGPVMRDLIALCNTMKPSSAGDALSPLGPYDELTFECFHVASKDIGYGDRPKSLRAFASDHKNVFYFYLAGSTTDDCPIAYEDVVGVEDPKIVAKDLVTWLSQLAYSESGDDGDAFDKKEYKRIAANLRLVPGVSRDLAAQELPQEIEDLDFEAKPAKAWAAALAEASAAAEAAAKPLAVGGASVSAKDVKKARKLHEKGGILANGSDAKKLGFLKEALAIVGGATEGDAAALRLDVEKDLMSNCLYAGKAKDAKALVERLVLDDTRRGLLDHSAWSDVGMIVEKAKVTVPVEERTAVQRAWATAILTEDIADRKPTKKVPKDGKDAYNQARVEMVHGEYDQALACLKVGKTDENWGTNSETLEVEVLRRQGKVDTAKRLWKQIAEREVDGTRFGHIDWTYMGALYVVLELSEPALAKRIAKNWNRNSGESSPSLFMLSSG